MWDAAGDAPCCIHADRPAHDEPSVSFLEEALAMLGRDLFARGVCLTLGVLFGVAAAGFMPHSPLHAVSNDRGETFAICTAPMDDEIEAIFFLDFLTGDLRAAALSPQTRKFIAYYQFNVLQSLGVDATKTPRYLMVSGMCDMRRGMGVRLGRGLIYIAEANSGKVAAFAVPWVREAINSGRSIQAALIPIDAATFRTAAVRPAAP
jgi:hypothetical protein